jgi:hypothetical protein
MNHEHHHRSEEGADAMRAVAVGNRKDAEEDADRDRHT